MKEFKTIFNPLIPIGRIAFSLFFCGLTFFIIYLSFRNYKTNELKHYLVITLGASVFAVIFHQFFKDFINTTKNYLINENSIIEYNYLTLKSKSIEKNDIKGFSTSTVPYRIWDFKQVIIYLKDGTKIDLMQFAYFNFGKIEQTFTEYKYNYFGHEPYIWKWVNSRVYKYDD